MVNGMDMCVSEVILSFRNLKHNYNCLNTNRKKIKQQLNNFLLENINHLNETQVRCQGIKEFFQNFLTLANFIPIKFNADDWQFFHEKKIYIANKRFYTNLLTSLIFSLFMTFSPISNNLVSLSLSIIVINFILTKYMNLSLSLESITQDQQFYPWKIHCQQTAF